MSVVKNVSEAIIIDDHDDFIEDISDDDDDDKKESPRLLQAKREFEELMKNPSFARSFCSSSQPVVVKKRPQVIVVARPRPIAQPPPTVQFIKAKDSLDNLLIEKRKKERQHIRRKKANKRKYQKQLWTKRFRNLSHPHHH